MQAIDPTSSTRRRTCGRAGVQREAALAASSSTSTYVGPARPLPAAGAQHQPAAGRHAPRQPGREHRGARPYKGYGTIRLSENCRQLKYHSLQVSVDRRYTGGLKLGMAYTLGKSEDNASDKRDISRTPTTTRASGGRRASNRTHVLRFPLHLRPAVLRELRRTWSRTCRGGRCGQSFFQSRRSSAHGDDIAGVGDSNGADDRAGVGEAASGSRSTSSAIRANANGQFSGPARSIELRVQSAARSRRPANGTVRQRAAQPIYRPWRPDLGHRAASRTSTSRDSRRMQFRAEVFNFPNHPNLNSPNTDSTSANFGRILAKSSDSATSSWCEVLLLAPRSDHGEMRWLRPPHLSACPRLITPGARSHRRDPRRAEAGLVGYNHAHASCPDAAHRRRAPAAGASSPGARSPRARRRRKPRSIATSRPPIRASRGRSCASFPPKGPRRR